MIGSGGDAAMCPDGPNDPCLRDGSRARCRAHRSGRDDAARM